MLSKCLDTVRFLRMFHVKLKNTLMRYQHSNFYLNSAKNCSVVAHEIITQSGLSLWYSRNMHNYTQRNFVVLHFSMCKSLRLSNYAKKHVHNKLAVSLYLRWVHLFHGAYLYEAFVFSTVLQAVKLRILWRITQYAFTQRQLCSIISDI